MKREKLMSEEFFRRDILYVRDEIQRRLDKLKNDTAGIYIKPWIFIHANAMNSLQLMLLTYSVGEPIGSIKPLLLPAIEAQHEYLQCVQTYNSENIDLRDIDDYVEMLWLISFAIILKVDEHTWNRLLSLVDIAGTDRLFDILIATKYTHRPISKIVHHEKIFATLLEVFTAEKDDGQDILMKYMKHWYTAMRNVYWHDNHKGPDGGGFFGYWAIEAAAVCMALSIGHEKLDSMDYFPKDLVVHS